MIEKQTNKKKTVHVIKLGILRWESYPGRSNVSMGVLF